MHLSHKCQHCDDNDDGGDDNLDVDDNDPQIADVHGHSVFGHAGGNWSVQAGSASRAKTYNIQVGSSSIVLIMVKRKPKNFISSRSLYMHVIVET